MRLKKKTMWSMKGKCDERKRQGRVDIVLSLKNLIKSLTRAFNQGATTANATDTNQVMIDGIIYVRLYTCYPNTT